MREAAIVSAVRTPVGKCRSALAPVVPHKLAAMVIKEAVRRANIDPTRIDDVIYGNTLNYEYWNLARIAVLEAGLPDTVPAATLDRQCGTSLNTFAYASALIEVGYHDIMVAGGMDSDSRRPYLVDRPTQAYQFDNPHFIESMDTPPERFINMGLTAENVAERYGIRREECDVFSYESHMKAAHAWDSGYFDEGVLPVTVDLSRGKTRVLAQDETVRRDTTVEVLSHLKPCFKDDGIVTAGNSSPLSDGASAVVLMERSLAEQNGNEILGIFRGFATVGTDPHYMGFAPALAIPKLLDKVGMTLDQMDLIEINEAFAAQTLACTKALELDPSKLNVNGGAIALGHPYAATGCILVNKMVYELKRQKKRWGLIAFCIGGGQGIAALIERV